MSGDPNGEGILGSTGEPAASDPLEVDAWSARTSWRRGSGRIWLRLDDTARREIVVALALLFCYGFFRQVPAWNEYSRYDLVRALVADGTTSIDRYHENTGDKAFFDGHYYSDKGPGTALLGVPVYLLLVVASEASTGGTPDPDAAIQVLAFVASGVTTVLLVLLLLRFLRPAVGERWALAVSLGYGLASLAFPFATMLFGHAAAAFFLFASFYVLWCWRRDPRRWRLLLAGLLAGLAVLVDISSLLGVLVLMVYASTAGVLIRRQSGGRARWQDALHGPALMVTGAIGPALLLAGYNAVSFGSPLSLGYGNLANAGFAEAMGRGILGVTWPNGQVLVELLVGERGLLRLAPWFLLVPAGLLAAGRRDLRVEVAVCGAMVVAFLAFNAGYYLPFGGWTPGPRFLLPALPFAAVLVALAPAALRLVTSCLIAFGAVLTWVATSTMPNAPELYADPFYELWLPRLLDGHIADTIAWSRWGLAGAVPSAVLGLGVGIAAVALLATLRPGALARRVTAFLVVVLVVLVAAFAVPVYPPWALDLALPRPSTPTGGPFSIAHVDATLVATSDRRTAIVSVQIENRGPVLDDTGLLFTAVGRDGREEWSAWYGDVDWAPGSRRRVTMEWDTRGIQSGDYRIGVSIVTASGAVHASADTGLQVGR